MKYTKTIKFRLVKETDAEFILSLRTRNDLNKYLSEVQSSIDKQINWIINYKKDEAKRKQFYFIIERLDGTPCGTVRLYDFKDNSFSWGSWILNENKTKYAAVESALMVYDYGFNTLNFEKSHFEVMKKNKGVVNFHKRFGASIVDEDEKNYYFNITREDVKLAKNELERILCKK